MEEPHCLAGRLVLVAAVLDIMLAVAVTWYRTLQKSKE
jgi:hypothetical protein